MAGTYVGLRVDPVSAKAIYDRCKELGVKDLLPINEYHATLYYGNQAPLENFRANPGKVHTAVVEGADIMGEGKWRALVLHLSAPSLVRRHQAIKTLNPNSPHSYPDFKPHLSVKYRPNAGEDRSIGNALKGIKIKFLGEYSEPIKED